MTHNVCDLASLSLVSTQPRWHRCSKQQVVCGCGGRKFYTLSSGAHAQGMPLFSVLVQPELLLDPAVCWARTVCHLAKTGDLLRAGLML